MKRFEGLEIPMYIVSKDTPNLQLELYNVLKGGFGTSIPFISDPDFELIEKMGMRNGDVAYRGYGMIDQEGKVIFTTINDHFGEESEATEKEIKEEYKKLEN